MFESMSEPAGGPVVRVGSARFRAFARPRPSLTAVPAAPGTPAAPSCADAAAETGVGALPVGPVGAEPASAMLARLAGGPPSAAGLAELDAIDLDSLGRFDRVVALQLWERHAAWLAGRTQAAIVAVGGARPEDEDDWAQEEIAAALRLSAGTAASRLAVARQLTGRLAATGAALTAGRIGYFHARVLVEATGDLDDRTAALVQATVLAGGAPDETLARFRQRLARVLIAAAPQDADQAHAAAAAERRVVLDPQPHGMAWLSAFLTAPEAMTVLAHINATAGTGPRPAPGVDDRPADVRRADAFVALLTDAAEAAPAADRPDPLVALCTPNRVFRQDGTLTDPTGRPASAKPPGRDRAGPADRPVIQVTVDLPTLLGLAEHPGELAGYGPIPPALARQLAADGDWQRLVTDPLTGHLLDLGRSTYRPPEALARFVRARDRTCRFPGCNRRAEHCDLDHACPWEQLGLTCPANLGPLCRRHHRLKTHAGWDLQSHPDGAATFTSPTGHTYPHPAIDHHSEHTTRQRERHAREQQPPDNLPPDDQPPADI